METGSFWDGYALQDFFVFWLVSILTKPEDKEKNEAFFDNMRRKSDARTRELMVKSLWHLKSGDDLLLLDLPGWFQKERWTNFFNRYREDLIGFLLSWLVVGLLYCSPGEYYRFSLECLEKICFSSYLHELTPSPHAPSYPSFNLLQ